MSNDIKNFTWPGWETVDMIGRGSFGSVYKIQRNIFGNVETAALKVISIPHNHSDVEELYNDGYSTESITKVFESHMQSIVAEYSLMRKLSGSANIVSCDDVRYIQRADGIGWDIFIKMELLTPLTSVLPAQIPEKTVIKLGIDMCRALEMCSRHNILHRDIKPQNIFVSAAGDYKLGDFGIAKTVVKTMGGTRIGTPRYMAPEVFNAKPYGSSADLYSLGLVLYWMLNEKRMPFLPLPPAELQPGMDQNAGFRRLSGEPLPPPAHGSEWLKRIVLKACAYDPKDRYQSAAELMEALQNPAAFQSVPMQPQENLDIRKTLTFPYNNIPAGKSVPVSVGQEQVWVRIPQQVQSGQTFYYPNMGARSLTTQKRGDLYITVQIEVPLPPPKRKSSAPVWIGICAAGAAILLVVLLALLLFGQNGQGCAAGQLPDSRPGVTEWDEPQPGTSGDISADDPTDPCMLGHTWSEATCTEASICTVCGETGEAPRGHKWIDATYSAPKTCSVCGATTGSKLKAEPVYINELTYSDKYGKIYYHDNQYVDYENNRDWTDLYTPGHIQQPVLDGYGNSFTYGLHMDGDQLGPYYVTYDIGGKYTSFSGWCVLPDYQVGTHNARTYSKYFQVYCDGKLVFTSNTMKNGSSSQYFEIDVTGVEVLTIQYAATNGPNDLAVLCDGLLE